ncbi:DUF4124 domain-containing protein [Marinobacter iranensis]|uniref:DUF4124 domain-containing protein n=1 Tax=Marinobacter iranensis TaxID=2962607 RepID=UPI0023DA3FF0|nr:DUF4124 domain-containing protein [Marinobacter iranensis]
MTYDRDGLLTGIHGFTIGRHADHGLPVSLDDGTLNKTFGYNGHGEVTDVSTELNQTSAFDYDLTYNSVGQIVGKTETLPDGTVNQYRDEHDACFRLTGLNQGGIVPRIFKIAALFCLCASFGLQAGVYKWVDENGRTHFSDKPPPNQQKRNVEVLNDRAKAPPSSSKAQADYRQPAASRILRIRKLFEGEEFGQLNSVLADSLRAVKTEIDHESQLREAYQVFQQDEPAWEALFDRWISRYPQQYQGYLARATYLVHRGWEARGGAYIDETPQKNIDRMVAFMNRAQSDLSRALSLEAGALWAYCLRINIAKSGGQYPDALRTLEQATKRYPATYLARKYYIEMLDPKWGGSPLSMISFANSAQHHVGTNPRLRQLVSYAYYEAGRMAYINKEYAQASGYLSIAIDKGGRPPAGF